MRMCRVILFVKDFDVMERFYREALGLEVIPESRTEGWTELRAGAVTLGLHAIPASVASGIETSTPPVAREETPIKLVFEASDIEATRQRIDAYGGVVIERPWGIDALDPEGNVFHAAPAACAVS